MREAHAAETEPPIRFWALACAVLVPFCAYVMSMGAHSYWLDSGEFTAASVYLDIAHPPGHPLSCLWGRAFTLLPLGPLPFRVALGQAVAATLALAALSVAFARSLASVGLGQRLSRELTSVAGTWLLAGSYGFWFQAARQEVYALQTLFVCIALERLTYAATRDSVDARPFYVATLCLGLGLANHHFMTVLALPALLYELVRLTRAQGLRPWLMGLSLGLFGLFGYVYLPIRASTLPPMDLGHPVTWANLVWVVTAQVYQKNVGSAVLQPLDERVADLTVLLVENLTFPTLGLTFLGAYAVMRSPRLHALAWLWGTTALVSMGGRIWTGSVRDNPDVLGYMMPGLAALVALALCGIGAVLALVEQSPRLRRAAVVTAGTALFWASLQFPREAARSSLAHFHATDDFDAVRRRSLPARTALVLVTPEAAFRHWDGEAVEKLRPDVTMVPMPFLGYGDSGKRLAALHADLAPLIDSYLLSSRLSVQRTVELARTRPVLVEADVSVSLGLFPHVVPSGVLYRVVQGTPTRQQIVDTLAERAAVYASLYRAIGHDLAQHETRRKLLWLHYTDALYYAYHGLVDTARMAAAQGLALAPQTEELVALERALVGRGEEPVDIRPFLLGSR
jgi:hypothetical protein